MATFDNLGNVGEDSMKDTMSRYVRGQEEGLAEVKGQTLRNVSLLENNKDKQ